MAKRTIYYSNTIQAIIGFVIGILMAVLANSIGNDWPTFQDAALAVFGAFVFSFIAFGITYYTPKSTNWRQTLMFAIPTAALVALIF